jgi:hypothetical protein
VLDVPQNSVDFAFGFLLAGGGKVWGADFQLEKVGTAVPVTSRDPRLPRKPENLNFEMTAPQANAQSAQSASLAAGKGRIFIHEPAPVFGYPHTKIKLNGKLIGDAIPDQFFFADGPPGDYTVSALVPDSFRAAQNGGYAFMQDAPATEHAVTFPRECRATSLCQAQRTLEPYFCNASLSGARG